MCFPRENCYVAQLLFCQALFRFKVLFLFWIRERRFNPWPMMTSDRASSEVYSYSNLYTFRVDVYLFALTEATGSYTSLSLFVLVHWVFNCLCLWWWFEWNIRLTVFFGEMLFTLSFFLVRDTEIQMKIIRCCLWWHQIEPPQKYIPTQFFIHFMLM